MVNGEWGSWRMVNGKSQWLVSHLVIVRTAMNYALSAMIFLGDAVFAEMTAKTAKFFRKGTQRGEREGFIGD